MNLTGKWFNIFERAPSTAYFISETIEPPVSITRGIVLDPFGLQRTQNDVLSILAG